MTYFYASGDDKAGNRLVTSYKQEAQAKKYRVGADIVEGLRYLDVENSTLTAKDTGLLVRTIMTKQGASDVDADGKFVVWGKQNNIWFETQFKYGTYAAANAAVKGALISLYEACAVIEVE